MTLKEFILNHSLKYNFKIVEINENINSKILNLIKKYKNNSENKKFLIKLKKIDKKQLGNFIFLLRCLDFRLWEFSQNWKYKNEKGFFGLVERVINLFKLDYRKIRFSDFKNIISPNESNSLTKLRHKIFKDSLIWLNKNFDGNFDNYFEHYQNPYDFSINLFALRKFQDYYKNLYFLKPNQLLFYEYILSKNLTKKFKNKLEELTIFADYKVSQVLINLDLINISSKYLNYLIKNRIFRKNSIIEIELRNASIILGEIISKKLKMPSYKVDNILWSLSNRINLKIPHLKVKTIYY